MTKTTVITTLFVALSLSLFGQNEWTEQDLSNFKFKEDAFPVINKDGSFILSGDGVRYEFDNQGAFKSELKTNSLLTPMFVALNTEANEPLTMKSTENITVFLKGSSIIYSLKEGNNENEPQTFEFENLTGTDTKGKKVEKVKPSSNDILSLDEKEIIFYHYYQNVSDQSHPGVVPQKGKNYSFVRIGKFNFKTGSASYEYVFVDQFEKHADIPVGKANEKKIHFIGIKNNRALFGFANYTATYIYVKTGSVDEAIKAPEVMTGYYEIAAVDLNTFQEETIVTEVIEKPAEAFAFYLFPTDYGFSLSWSKRFDRTIFESHVELIEVNDNFSIEKTSLLLPVEDLPMRWGIPLYLKKVKDIEGNEWFAINAQFANSNRRKDLKDQTPVVLMINKEGSIQYRDNSALEWSVNGDFIQGSKEFEGCLPCLIELSSSEYKFLSEPPTGESIKEASNASTVSSGIQTYYIREGNIIHYVQVFLLQKMNIRTGELTIKKLYTRTGEIVLE